MKLEIFDNYCPNCKSPKVYPVVKREVMECTTCKARWDPVTRKLIIDIEELAADE